MLKFLLCCLLLASNLWGDARYKLAYKVKANLLIQLAARVAGLSKLNSDGQEVLLKGSRILVRGETTTMIVDYGTGRMIVIDHSDKTYERLRIEDMKQRIAKDFPPALIDGLKSFFSGGAGGISTVVKAEEFGEQEEMPSLARFRIAYGLGYLMPGMESIVPLAPSVDEGIKAVRKQGRLPIALRVQIGKSLDAVVEIREYREGMVAEKEFLPPTGYEEVKE